MQALQEWIGLTRWQEQEYVFRKEENARLAAAALRAQRAQHEKLQEGLQSSQPATECLVGEAADGMPPGSAQQPSGKGLLTSSASWLLLSLGQLRQPGRILIDLMAGEPLPVHAILHCTGFR